MIVQAIFTAIFAITVTQFTKDYDIKPLNCELCMTFWISLFVASGTFENIIDITTFIGVAMATRQTLYKVCPTLF